MKKILIVTVFFALSLFAVNTFMPIHGEEKIYDSVLRLHVIANSDSEEDQALKLKVRDRVLFESERLIGDADGRDSAVLALQNALPYLTECAQEVVDENGFDYRCELTLSRERYPEKSYENVCFPSGEYMSLQVKLGEHEGKNWWCVLFPQLCLSASGTAEEMLAQVGLTPDQYKIITQSEDTKYKIRFKFLELIEETLSP